MANLVTIESMKTVMPIKMTERKSIQVTVAKDHLPEIFQRRIHVVLYYKKAVEEEEEPGWLVAGWMKESLGTALLDQPMLGGRLRRVETGGDGGGGEMEIVSNDCGIRFLEAQIKIDLSEFLEAKGKEEEEEEAKLVFWEDIDELNPQFSPLCYVQVTNFECGGYAIGLSCSTLVTDPLAMTSFLKNWFNIHKNMISRSDITKKPLFYLSNRRKTGEPISVNVNSSISSRKRTQTVIFNVSSSENLISGSETKRAFAAICIKEAERKFGKEMPSKLSLIIKESCKEIKTESFSRKEVFDIAEKPLGYLNNLGAEVLSLNNLGVEESSLNDLGAEELSLKDLGVEELSLSEGTKPVSGSFWITSGSDEGVVMVIPSLSEGISGIDIIITIPNDQKMAYEF